MTTPTSQDSADTRRAVGAGIATLDSGGAVLDTWFPAPRLGEPTGVTGEAEPGAGGSTGTTELSDEAAVTLLGESVRGALGADAVRDVRTRAVMTVIADLDAPPVDAYDVYLRLHLLSHRLVQPNSINLDGVFGLLNNVVWTTLGPCPVAGFDAVRMRARGAGVTLQVFGIDKFPRMVDYVIPSGVRIADADRVRLGAHLAEGTTVMHEGFCNFNAGTLGTSMVEGRISQGVIVDDGADIGGGASIMGTLSGGGTERVRIGPSSLVGANAGIGISLGENCVVEAGCYVTAGAKVTLPDGSVRKARELSGKDAWLFRRNSATGVLEAVPRTKHWGGLNEALHSNA